VDHGAFFEYQCVGHLVVDQRRRPHAVATSRVDVGAQRVLPAAAEARAGDAGAAFRLGDLGCFPHRGRGRPGDRPFDLAQFGGELAAQGE
jgi:hypothetical protein